jgi:hypothetical protein
MTAPELHPLLPYSNSIIGPFVYIILLVLVALCLLCLLIFITRRLIGRYKQNRPLRKGIKNIEKIASTIDLAPSLRLKRITLELFQVSSYFQISDAKAPTLPTKEWLVYISKEKYDMTCYPYNLLSDVCFLPPNELEKVSDAELNQIKRTLIQLIKTYYV